MESQNVIQALTKTLHSAFPEGAVDLFHGQRVTALELPKEMEVTSLSHLSASDTHQFSTSDLARMTLSDGRVLETNLVVWLNDGRQVFTFAVQIGADGVQSHVRKAAGIHTGGWDYGQRGLVATLELDTSLEGYQGNATAWQRFLPTGPIAMLPVGEIRGCHVVLIIYS